QGVHQSHTATHIIHWALRDVLGEHARQQGSLVEPGRLRFDFSHYEGLGQDGLADVEHEVNRRVMRDDPVRAFETTYDFAIASGAMALFGEKYGDIVRMVEVGDYSKELCGGTHVARTGRIGVIKFVHEGSVASGVRRVEALTGMAGLDHLNEQAAKLKQVASALKTDPEQVIDKLEKLLQTAHSMERQLAAQREQGLKGELHKILSSDAVKEFGSSRLIVLRRDGETVDDLRKLVIALRDGIDSGIVLLGAANNGQANVLAAVTRDLVGKGVSSAELVSSGAQMLDGRGGGKPDLALGGGPQGSKIDAALGLMETKARELLAKD
ncbi:MAG: DHHA1 domain-containing protein, partial [Actinomycetota bacterium]